MDIEHKAEYSYVVTGCRHGDAFSLGGYKDLSLLPVKLAILLLIALPGVFLGQEHSFSWMAEEVIEYDDRVYWSFLFKQ